MHHSTSVAGEILHLLPERAIFWQQERTLLVADAHFGKAATFRARGLPVPKGTTLENLVRLTRLIERWAARRVIFLGDFTHSYKLHGRETGAALHDWRAAHSGVELLLVRGNHDAPGTRVADEFGIDVVEEPFSSGPFALRHHPLAHEQRYVLAGHLHPAFRLAGRGRDRARLPCFWFGKQIGVLPAFGAFTGSAVVAPGPGEKIFLVAPGAVYALPVQGVHP